ncbi:putative antitoxin VapB7 [Pseudonocardia asaccharolytica DSM 44247 = NBRC 16224]|uniref:Putative antitoxin VapB7 n=2 Tax=Pseudonocardia asaccharolytica TaxID=54010 RepID=A0A511CZ61_9PSEU|nr:putative antitoxin VapB7 [Pseudonocardia asaccharolytica DSM 44247 = NBRC 16224]
MTRRLQILLDEDRYQRVAAAARARRTSVATVIREAIDRGLPADDDERGTALQRILSAEPAPVPDDPAELVAELHELRSRLR